MSRRRGRAATDPDSLWEEIGRRYYSNSSFNPSCHEAVTPTDFRACTEARLILSVEKLTSTAAADAFGWRSLDTLENYSHVERRFLQAAHFAVYHAFIHDYLARRDESYTPGSQEDPALYKLYHKRMMRAYEQHLRRLGVEAFVHRANQVQFQMDLTRSVGQLAIRYATVFQAVESTGSWGDDTQRGEALALLTAMGQRLWWEWLIAQPEGPPTAGLADFGSQETFDDALGARPWPPRARPDHARAAHRADAAADLLRYGRS